MLQDDVPLPVIRLEPRGRPPAGPYHNTGVAREQKSLLAKLFNDIESLKGVSTTPSWGSGRDGWTPGTRIHGWDGTV